jgi:hypothetical protein
MHAWKSIIGIALCATALITFSVRIAFDASGHLSTEGAVVQLPGCSVDVCR